MPTWLLGPWGYVIAAGFAAVLAGAGTGWIVHRVDHAAYVDLQLKDANAIKQAMAQAAVQQAAADKITHDTDVANAAAHQQVVTQIQHIIQKVPVYVTAKTDTAFPLPCGFVRLHDAAASATDPAAVPIPSGKSDADKCDVTASYAASIIAGNYGLALGWKADAVAWNDWYAKQAANWNAK